ncbi:hypothetical protein NEOKW01_1364 [Nematocida sp. AWRm80]|nr:hypothetical protein NEOKW01_1364 [Nematocida sp. AWRm80]
MKVFLVSSIVQIMVFLGCCVLVAAEEKLYAFEKKGYLFNVGLQRFMGKGDVHGSVQFLKVVPDPKQAILLDQISAYHDENVFTLFLIDGLTKTEKNPSKIYPNRLGINRAGKECNIWVSMEGAMDSPSHRASITTAKDPYSEIVVIHMSQGCLTVSTVGNAKILPCVGRTSSTAKYQEWIWIDQERYNTDMSHGHSMHYTGVQAPANPSTTAT